MDVNGFWSVVDRVKDSPQPEVDIKEELRDLPPEEIVSYQEHLDRMRVQAYKWDLWGAACLINAVCPEEDFLGFRYWLISRGRRIYQEAIDNPDSLADLPTYGDHEDHVGVAVLLASEDFGHAALTVYKEITGEEMQRGDVVDREPQGELWDVHHDVEEAATRLPRLFAKLCSAGADGPLEISREHSRTGKPWWKSWYQMWPFGNKTCELAKHAESQADRYADRDLPLALWWAATALLNDPSLHRTRTLFFESAAKIVLCGVTGITLEHSKDFSIVHAQLASGGVPPQHISKAVDVMLSTFYSEMVTAKFEPLMKRMNSGGTPERGAMLLQGEDFEHGRVLATVFAGAVVELGNNLTFVANPDRHGWQDFATKDEGYSDSQIRMWRSALAAVLQPVSAARWSHVCSDLASIFREGGNVKFADGWASLSASHDDKEMDLVVGTARINYARCGALSMWLRDLARCPSEYDARKWRGEKLLPPAAMLVNFWEDGES